MKRAQVGPIGWAALVAGAVVSLVGCDRVGSALVGHDAGQPHPKPPGIPCTAPPACDDAFVELPDAELVRRSVAHACGAEFAACPRVTPADEDAGAGAPELQGCTLVDDQAELTRSARSVSDCSQLLVENRASRLGAALTLHDVAWSASNFAISSRTPWTLELEGASLRDVFIELSGPVTLRVVRPVKLDNVRVASGTPELGPPELELFETGEGILTAGDQSQAFHGTVHMTRTNLSGPQLIADRIALESVTFKSAIIEAEDLNASDANITSATLSFETAVISASTLFDVHVVGCGSLTLLRGEAHNFRLSTCRRPPARVYGTSVVRGVVDGEIESDLASWTRVIFGLHAPTNLIVWGSDMASNQFCAQSQSAKFGYNSRVRCSACETEPYDVPDACIVPPTVPGLPDNYCPMLKQAPACEQPLPIRTHPEPNSNFF